MEWFELIEIAFRNISQKKTYDFKPLYKSYNPAKRVNRGESIRDAALSQFIRNKELWIADKNKWYIL